MAKDIKMIRAKQRLQHAILNGSIPATPNEENILSRRTSKPTLFSLARQVAANQEQAPRSSSTSPDRGLVNQQRSSLTSSRSVENLSGVSIHTSPPPSTDTLSHNPQLQQQRHQHHLRSAHSGSSSLDIHRIQEENNEVLSKVNNSPVEYSKSYETE
jgi:hypothetical protein